MPGSPEEITHLMKLRSGNTCLQSNLNWVMVLHHVTVPRQLTGGPLLCVRGVTCHMIDDTTGVQGLGVIASLNHFVCRSGRAAYLPHARLSTRAHRHLHAKSADNAGKNQQTHTDSHKSNKLQFVFSCVFFTMRDDKKFRSERQEK